MKGDYLCFTPKNCKKIIDQLQHAQVDGIGYFDTLLLILKLIALCAKPILFVICLILILIWIPKWISYKLTPTPDNMKRYNCYFILKCKNGKYRLQRDSPLQFNTIKYTSDYLKLLCKRGFLRYKITCVFSVIVSLLISPFFFSEIMRFPAYAFMIVMGSVMRIRNMMNFRCVKFVLGWNPVLTFLFMRTQDIQQTRWSSFVKIWKNRWNKTNQISKTKTMMKTTATILVTTLGIFDLKYEQKTLGLNFWCLFCVCLNRCYIYRIHQKTPDRICPAFYIVYGCGVNRMN